VVCYEGRAARCCWTTNGQGVEAYSPVRRGMDSDYRIEGKQKGQRHMKAIWERSDRIQAWPCDFVHHRTGWHEGSTSRARRCSFCSSREAAYRLCLLAAGGWRYGRSGMRYWRLGGVGWRQERQGDQAYERVKMI